MLVFGRVFDYVTCASEWSPIPLIILRNYDNDTSYSEVRIYYNRCELIEYDACAHDPIAYDAALSQLPYVIDQMRFRANRPHWLTTQLCKFNPAAKQWLINALWAVCGQQAVLAREIITANVPAELWAAVLSHMITRALAP